MSKVIRSSHLVAFIRSAVNTRRPKSLPVRTTLWAFLAISQPKLPNSRLIFRRMMQLWVRSKKWPMPTMSRPIRRRNRSPVFGLACWLQLYRLSSWWSSSIWWWIRQAKAAAPVAWWVLASRGLNKPIKMPIKFASLMLPVQKKKSRNWLKWLSSWKIRVNSRHWVPVFQPGFCLRVLLVLVKPY